MPPFVRRYWKDCRGSRREAVRRCASSSFLLAYVIIAVGVPLPGGSLTPKSDEVFPCMGCGCGCRSAEQCWRSCCCHPLAERLDWAREHGVRPPEFVLAEARAKGFDVTWLASVAGEKYIHAASQVAQADAENCRHSCCAKHQPKSSAPQSTISRIIGWRALGCHGQSLDWIAAVPTLVGVRLELSDQLPRAGWIRSTSSHLAAGRSDTPPVPPPPERA